MKEMLLAYFSSCMTTAPRRSWPLGNKKTVMHVTHTHIHWPNATPRYSYTDATLLCTFTRYYSNPLQILKFFLCTEIIPPSPREYLPTFRNKPRILSEFLELPTRASTAPLSRIRAYLLSFPRIRFSSEQFSTIRQIDGVRK